MTPFGVKLSNDSFGVMLHIGDDREFYCELESAKIFSQKCNMTPESPKQG